MGWRQVCLTDGESFVLPLLRHNAALNAAPGRSLVAVRRLDLGAVGEAGGAAGWGPRVDLVRQRGVTNDGGGRRL